MAVAGLLTPYGVALLHLPGGGVRVRLHLAPGTREAGRVQRKQGGVRVLDPGMSITCLLTTVL